MLAVGWYTPVTSLHSEPDASIVWGIAVIIAFLLGFAARGGRRPIRIRQYFDYLNAGLRRSIRPDGVGFIEAPQVSPIEQTEQAGLETSARRAQIDLTPQVRVPPSSLN